MLFRYEHPDVTWVDLEQPTEDEIRLVAREFGISDRIELELLSPTPAPLVAGAPGIALLVLHFPAHDGDSGDTKDQEIDFIVGSRFILTVRYEVVAPLYHLKKLLETEAYLAEEAPMSADALLEILFAHLYGSVRDHAHHNASELARVERDMFDGRERDTVRTISAVSRKFLHLEAALATQEEPLARFLKALTTRNFFGPHFAERAARIQAERAQMAHLVRTHRAVASELRETNNALLSAKQNEIIKILTVVSFIFLPLALIAKIFAMKMDSLPFAKDPNGFWIVIGIMLALAAVLTLFVWRKRWL